MAKRSVKDLKYKPYFLSGTQDVRDDLGTTSINGPAEITTGKRVTIEVTYKAGDKTLLDGGAVRFAVPLPFESPQIDNSRKGGYCKAVCSNRDVKLQIKVNPSPFTGFDANDGHCGAFARSVFVHVSGTGLAAGDTITLKYTKGTAAMWSGWFDFTVFVDPNGKRRARNSGYSIVAGSPRLFVHGRKADHFKVYLDANLGRTAKVSVAARDELDDFDGRFTGKATVTPGGKKLAFKKGLAKASVPAGNKDVMRVKVGKNLSNPAKKPGKYNIYWGDLHTHSLVYDGIGTPKEVYTHGRDVTKLDFQSVSEHSFYDPSMYQYIVESADAFNDPGKFVTFLGYEARTTDHGDINFYFPGASSPHPPKTKFKGTYNTYPLKKYLATLGKRTLIVPHCHLKPSIDYPATLAGSGMMPLVEIYSQWGNFEKPGGQFTSNPKMRVNKIQAIVNNLLAGLRVGFTGGSDNHSCHPGYGWHMRADTNFPGGLTAVFATEKTRKGIWNALTKRRCFATTGCRMLIEFAVNGVAMGGEKKASPAERIVTASVNGEGPIKQIDIVRNGKDVKSFDVGGKLDYHIEWADEKPAEKVWLDETKYTAGKFMFYYLRVTQEDGQIGWASPVWFDKK